jgi:hypothetical protein
MPHAALASAANVPWYRERWPWLLMSGPAIVVVAALGTAWIAWSTDDGVVADDYYKRGLVINREIERAGRGEMLRIGAVLTLAPDGAIQLELSGAPDVVMPAMVKVRFANATRAGLDRTASLARMPDGIYAGRIEPLPPGRWQIAAETDAWRLPAQETSGVVREVRLGAARVPD